MATCIVTGGAGFLGSHLCDELLRRGHRVVCVDNFETGSLANIEHIRVPEFRHLNVDIIKPFFVEDQVDFVYHLASPASPIDYLRLPLHTLKVGSHGTHNALGLAKEHRARFLLASTSEVYGDPQVHPQPETYWGHVNPIGPRGVYDEAKRYAEALTMAYHTQQGVDTSIIRIFNSILADEQVLYDDGRQLRRERVSDAAARLAAVAVPAGIIGKDAPESTVLSAGFSPAMEYPTPGFTVPAFGSAGNMAPSPALALLAHPTDERCFEVHTRYGRSIRVTGHHSVYVEGTDGEPKARPVVGLEVGDRIAVARRIDVPERDREDIDLLEVWRAAEGDPWELLVEAPGLGQLAWEHRRDLFGLMASERRPSNQHWRNGIWTRLIRMRETDRVPLACLARLGIGVPAEARVRRRVAGGGVSLPSRFGVTDELLWFLGLWVAEGSWHETEGNAFLTLACDAERVARAAEIVRRVFGLHVVITDACEERAAAMFVHSKLLLRLMEFLGFEPARKHIPGWILGLPLSRLRWFLEGYREGDGVHSGTHFDEGRRHEFSTTSDDLKDDLIVAFARFGLVPSVGRYVSSIKARPGQTYPFWRLTICNVSPWSMLEWDENVVQKLNARVTGDLVWAQVTRIEEVPATDVVYDFSVPGRENFWAGSGVMAANTYGPRMRPHDGRAIPTFLRQALQDRPITVFGDGSQTRSFCYVDDLVRGMIALAESGHHLPVNVGNPDEFTLLELAETVVDITSSRSEIVYEALPTDDPQVRRPDITKASELLEWAPEITLREGLKRTLDEAGAEALVGAAR